VPTLAGPCAPRPSDPVLVVEDHDDTRHMVELFLQMDGFSVHAVAHGLEALECLVEQRPCLILLDLSMPVMDGITFGRTLRQHPDPELAMTPIVLLTALSDLGDAIEATGAIDLITKPVDFDRLVQTVKKYCSSESLAAPVVIVSAPALSAE